MPTYKMQLLDPELNFGFAWDPDSASLYIVHGNGQPHEQIAGNIHAPEHAEILANMWLKGYRSRAREDGRKLGSKYYHLLAETGAVGAKLGPGG
jgi:hypothetical protein